jgi:hypothetical protein
MNLPPSGSRTHPVDWAQEIGTADTEHELVAVVHAYVTTWSPAELASIPRHCRPGDIVDGAELADIALRLTREHLDGSRTVVDQLLLDRMAAFFAQATLRLTQILAPARSTGLFAPPARQPP